MRISILGTGHMGRTLGEAFSKAGHDVVFGSRNPDQQVDLPGPATGYTEAARDGDVILSALAAAHSMDILPSLREPLSGRVLIDIGNAVNEQMELIYPDSSLGERLQKALPETKVVKTLNTVGGPIGVDPARLSAPTSIFLSGDDPESKALVSRLLADLGWEPERQVDLGGIATARAVEHYFLLFAALMGTFRSPAFNIAVTR
ncbi:NAD(P)-binding domain-containing protein [Arthrobacter sp. zg-Y20]|uniref:NADPH-dependent F420 reductase n=1 Tax=unclassified Arthrobacter TaxID=235627 RepID=UPI001D153598|nr:MULTISPECIES: NAD(P)-binding domain-containing protein [unclassified Arthrobacter]MCC3277367.1 NAD(P)-binding domain-containing protein [Arthrobacter sp. zg-Y20]MDK1317527.1 NAD(P)-binding domain-containing protein [Arthrobacter sp. zg.Y20]WIB06975.1 NAD(P)-binding domain-containing protein [Arthrobacter sp. zg-Y20]